MSKNAIEKMKSDINTAAEQYAAQARELSHMQRKLSEVSEQRDNLATKLRETEKAHERAQERLATWETEATELGLKLFNEKVRVEMLQKDRQTLIDEVSVLRTTNQSLAKELNGVVPEWSVKVEQAEKRIDELLAKCSDLNAQLTTALCNQTNAERKLGEVVAAAPSKDAAEKTFFFYWATGDDPYWETIRAPNFDVARDHFHEWLVEGYLLLRNKREVKPTTVYCHECVQPRPTIVDVASVPAPPALRKVFVQVFKPSGKWYCGGVSDDESFVEVPLSPGESLETVWRKATQALRQQYSADMTFVIHRTEPAHEHDHPAMITPRNFTDIA